jgi:thermostable 8-oxoguanine DNA glycosylase
MINEGFFYDLLQEIKEKIEKNGVRGENEKFEYYKVNHSFYSIITELMEGIKVPTVRKNIGLIVIYR